MRCSTVSLLKLWTTSNSRSSRASRASTSSLSCSKLAFLKRKKRTAQHNISQGELSASKNRYCVVTGQTYTAEARPVNPVNAEAKPDNPSKESKSEKKKNKGCVICSKRGKKADHGMKNCPIWTNLTVSERKKLVKCEKHIFTDNHDTANCTVVFDKQPVRTF